MPEENGLRLQLARQTSELERARRELEAMRATRSWRLTAPLRSAFELLASRRAARRRQMAPAGAAAGLVVDSPGEETPPGHRATAPAGAAPNGAPAATPAAAIAPPEPDPPSYTLNNAAFWDAYVRDWEKVPENRELRHVGNEWKNEEVFLALLEKYSARGDTALEIGCGGGRITASGVKLFRQVYAADVSGEMLRRCQESVVAPNVSFHTLDGFTLGEFADGTVDHVYSHDVFVHFSSLQVFAYFDEIKRVLKPGGIGLISFYNFFGSFDLFKTMSLQFREQRMFPPHMRVHFTTEAMLRAMLTDLDLDVLEVDTRNFLIVAFQKQSAER